MKDQLISFRTAKLAKEKGFSFNNSTTHFYNIDGKCLSNKYKTSTFNCIASTQSILQKWLREEYNIHFVIKPFYNSKTDITTYTADPIHIPTGRTSRSIRGTYEEALDDGEQRALKLIKIKSK